MEIKLSEDDIKMLKEISACKMYEFLRPNINIENVNISSAVNVDETIDKMADILESYKEKQ